jgi:hypothetical protein
MNKLQALLNLWLQVLWIDLARRIYVCNISDVSLSDFFLAAFIVEGNAK